MSDNINIVDKDNNPKTVGTRDDGTEHFQRTLANSRAVASGSDPTSVSAGAYVDPIGNRRGMQYVVPASPNMKTFNYRGSGSVTGQDIITPTSGKKVVLVSVNLNTPDTNDETIDFKFGFTTADGSLGDFRNVANNAFFPIDQHHYAGATDAVFKVTTVQSGGTQLWSCFGQYYEIE